jgi:Arc/MetJ family transcription regulator
VIFKAVSEGRPYPDHGLSLKEWSQIPPRPVRLDQLVTTKRELALDRLLAEDSTFYGDLFPHVVAFEGVLYLEDGVHRALRAALQQRTTIHARMLTLPIPPVKATASIPATATISAGSVSGSAPGSAPGSRPAS